MEGANYTAGRAGAASVRGNARQRADYPPYCSKYNPIEHRLFPDVTRACQGVVFHTAQIVKGQMEKISTGSGPQVTADILDKV